MSYSSEVLADSPLAYWRLGESSGTTMVDASGNGHNGTYSGGFTLGSTGLLTGDSDTAVAFNGSTGLGRVTHGSWMNSSAITVEAWVSPSTLGDFAILGRDQVVQRAFSMGRQGSDGKIWSTIYAGGNQYDVKGAPSPTLNVGDRLHIVMTYDGTTLKQYLNGTLSASLTVSQALHLPVADITVGRMDQYNFWPGRIDEVAYYGTALSAARIAAHYAAAVSVFTGSGDATAPTPVATGVGTSTVTGTGTATAPVPTSAGSNLATGTGVGAATAPVPVAAGEGWPSVEALVTVEFVVEVDASVMVTLTPAAELPGTVPVLAEAYLMPALTEADPVYQARVDYGVTIAEVGAVHLWVGGVDVTYFRGVPTKILRWDSEAPFGDKAAAWEMPCMEPWERPGVGDFAFMRPDAEVVIGYVDDEGTVRREWEGFYDARTRNLGDARSSVFEAKGEMWAALHHVHEPLPYLPPTDIGVVIPRLLNAIPGRKFPKIPQTTTGILTRTRGARDAWTWQVVQDVFAQAWTDDGRQWTLAKVGGKPRLALKKPMSEVTATVAWGTPLVDIDITVDESSRVDVVWARGKAPGGGEWANVYYPGLELLTPPPFPNDPVVNINVGDTDAGTDTGTGVSDWQRKVNALNRWGRLAVDGSFGTTDSRVLRDIQGDLGLTVDGSLGPQSWEGTFGVGVANIDLTPLRLPMIAKPDARQRLYDSHGRDLGANPAWTGTMVPREIPLDLGTNITRAQGLKACRTYLAVHGTPSVTGSVDFIGDPNGTDRTRLQVGDNLRILGVEGRDVTVQLASKSCELDGDSDGRNLVVRFTFDERARDALTIDAILERNRAALPDPARRPGNPNRSSRNVRDEGFTWDVESPCGIVERLAVNGASGLWSKRLMPVAEFGTLSRIFVEADHPFYFALFANLAITPNVMRALVGNPSTSTDPFRPHMAELENRWGLVEAWGQQGDACGYSPLTEGDDGAVFTGEFDFRTPLDYITGGDPYLAVLMFFTGGSGFADLRAYPAKDAG